MYTREPKQPGRKGVAATVVFDLTIQPSSIHLMIPPTPPHHSLSDTLLFRRCPFAESCFTVFSPCSCTVEYEGRAGGVKYIGLHNNHRPTKTNFISDFSEIHNTSTHGRMQLSWAKGRNKLKLPQWVSHDVVQWWNSNGVSLSMRCSCRMESDKRLEEIHTPDWGICAKLPNTIYKGVDNHRTRVYNGDMGTHCCYSPW